MNTRALWFFVDRYKSRTLAQHENNEKKNLIFNILLSPLSTLTLFHGNILMIVLALDYTLFSSSSLFLCNSQLCDVTQMNSFHTTHSFFFLCFVMYSRYFVRIIIKCIKLHQTMEWRRVKHQRRSSF